MKVLVVGDIHGDWGKLNSLLTVKRPDIVLQCGDFGWWPAEIFFHFSLFFLLAPVDFNSQWLYSVKHMEGMRWLLGG